MGMSTAHEPSRDTTSVKNMSTRHEPQNDQRTDGLVTGDHQPQSTAEILARAIGETYSTDAALSEKLDTAVHQRFTRLDDHYDDPDAEICSILSLEHQCLISETRGSNRRREMEVHGDLEDLEPLQSLPGFIEIESDDFFDERGTATLVLDDRNPRLLALMKVRAEYWANYWTREEADGIVSGKYAPWNLTADHDALVAAHRNLRKNTPLPRTKTAAEARQQVRVSSRILAWLDDENSTEAPPAATLDSEHTSPGLPTDFESLAHMRSERFATEAVARDNPGDFISVEAREKAADVFGDYVEMLISKRSKESEYARIVGAEEFAHHKAKLALWQTGWTSTTPCPPMPTNYVGLPPQLKSDLKLN